MKNLKVELSVERYQRLSIRRGTTHAQGWCEACGEQVVMLSGEEAAKLIGKPSREVYHQVEQGLWHCGDNPDGTLIICVKSLLAGSVDLRGGRRRGE
jgi:hypothetical protein